MKVWILEDLTFSCYNEGSIRGVFDSREKAEKGVMDEIDIEEIREEIAFDTDRDSSEVTDKEVLDYSTNPDNDFFLIIETEVK